MLAKSREGRQWTPNGGVEHGLPTEAAITDSDLSSPIPDPDTGYDVIVVGAGYTGLAAARDLTNAGKKTLLLEGRDRIGGRTWTADIDGYKYELGGTWVHWNQPFVWRELARYGMTEQLAMSPLRGVGLDSVNVVRESGIDSLSHDQEFDILESAIRKVVDVDGRLGRDIMPFPHHALSNTEARKWDHLSIGERIGQLAGALSDIELELLQTFLSITTGGSAADSSFLDLLRWWALNNYDLAQWNDLCLTFKLRDGQSRLARNMYEDAKATGNFSSRFSAPVQSVTNDGDLVYVKTRDGSEYRARRVISTVPLNVLCDIEWFPRLHPAKMEASRWGHVNRLTKVHIEVNNPDLRSFSAYRWKGPLSYAFGDGTTPAGNTHLVSFGCSLPGSLLALHEDRDIQKILDAAKAFDPAAFADLRKLVYHDWNDDEFAKGAWEFLRPEMTTKYIELLRERHGNVFFASADWSQGWRGFIDGGIQDGIEAAASVVAEIR